MDINNIGKTIADLRKKNNMSQQELASKLNVSNKTISNGFIIAQQVFGISYL